MPDTKDLIARQTPLVDLLGDIPADARMIYEHSPTCSRSIPVGRLAAEAKDALESQAAELARAQQRAGECEGGYETLEREVEALKAELARVRAGAVPEGWKLVPAEPTDEMIEAGRDVKRRRLLRAVEDARAGLEPNVSGATMAVQEEWAAMLAASPTEQPARGGPQGAARDWQRPKITQSWVDAEDLAGGVFAAGALVPRQPATEPHDAAAAQPAAQNEYIRGLIAAGEKARNTMSQVVGIVTHGAHPDHRDARIAELEAEMSKLRTVMVAAAEEIHEHWAAHCDAEGYGPQNLMRRLEEGIAVEYGYTAGLFAQQKSRIAELEGMLRSCSIADVHFRWDNLAGHHIPSVIVEFAPESPAAPHDTGGWKDRDAFVDAVTAASATLKKEPRSHE